MSDDKKKEYEPLLISIAAVAGNYGYNSSGKVEIWGIDTHGELWLLSDRNENYRSWVHCPASFGTRKKVHT